MTLLHDVVISGTFLFISVASLFGNCIVLFTIYRHSQNLFNSFNVLVASLAVVVMFNSVISTPLALNFLLSGSPKTITKSICFVHSISFCIVTTLLLTSLALLTINRYYRVVKPSVFQQVFTVRRSLLLLFSLGMANLIITPAVMAAVTPIATYRLDRVDCFQFKQPLVGLVIYLVIYLAPSTTTVIVFYVKTHMFLYRAKSAAVAPLSASLTTHLHNVEAKTLKVLIVLLFSFYCCLLPVIIVWIAEQTTSEPPYILTVTGLLFEHLISIVTPGVYVFVSRYYRKELLKLFTCNCTY